MDIRLVRRLSQGTLKIVENRSRLSFKNKEPGALDLVQGKIVEMVCAANIAEGASGVKMGDVRGSCPQNFIVLAIVGEVADVSEALGQIQAGTDEMKNL